MPLVNLGLAVTLAGALHTIPATADGVLHTDSAADESILHIIPDVDCPEVTLRG